jgi:predicted DNA-binding protein YlxM (UPF0122 family)
MEQAAIRNRTERYLRADPASGVQSQPYHSSSGHKKTGSPENRNCLSDRAPGGRQSANKKISLIEDSIPLPALLQIRSRAVLERLYKREKLSVREIARLTETSHSTILSALSKFEIPQNGNGHKRRGQIPFGYEYKDFKLIKRKDEQEIIRMIRQYRVNGLSLQKIADELNQKLVPTKNCVVWQANTVKKIV